MILGDEGQRSEEDKVGNGSLSRRKARREGRVKLGIS